MADQTKDSKYNGEEQLVIAIDLGTTQCTPFASDWAHPAADTPVAAVAYSHLYPNSVPAVRIASPVILCCTYSNTSTQVNKWPGQEEVAGDSKVRIRRLTC